MNSPTLSAVEDGSSWAVWSLVMSLLLLVLGPFASVPGIIFGKMAVRECVVKGRTKGLGMAKAGIVIGWIGLGLFVAGLVVGLVAWNMIGEMFGTMQEISE